MNLEDGTILSVHVNAEGVWADLSGRKILKATLTSVGALPHGMTSGRTSVALRIELNDGSVVFAETSLRLFQQAAAAFTGRYGLE